MTTQRQQVDIDLTPVFEALERPLALVDSPERRDEMQRFANASRGYQERAIFDLLSRLAQSVNDTHTGAELRLEYRNGGLSLTVEAERPSEPEEPVIVEGGEQDRLTLRLPPRIKQEVERAASQAGISVNHWCARALGAVAFRQTRGHWTPDEAAAREGDRHGPWRGRRNRIIIETDGPGFPGMEALRRHGAMHRAFHGEPGPGDGEKD